MQTAVFGPPFRFATLPSMPRKLNMKTFHTVLRGSAPAWPQSRFSACAP
jgi:hypothetical protein